MPKKKAPSPDTPPVEADQETPDTQDAQDAQAVSDPMQRLQAAAAESYDRLSEAAAQLSQQARALYETSEDFVRSNQGIVVLGAFALGCFLGVLLARD